jgi:peptidoglycan biosynthesis protein MviN/MurJ (putative lipid II flippase)
MELMFVILISAAIGLGLTYASREGRHTYGVLLLPAVSAVVTSIVWVGLLWLGFTFDGGWIWAISLVAGGIVALVLALRLPKSRQVADHGMLTALSGGKA